MCGLGILNWAGPIGEIWDSWLLSPCPSGCGCYWFVFIFPGLSGWLFEGFLFWLHFHHCRIGWSFEPCLFGDVPGLPVGVKQIINIYLSISNGIWVQPGCHWNSWFHCSTRVWNSRYFSNRIQRSWTRQNSQNKFDLPVGVKQFINRCLSMEFDSSPVVIEILDFIVQPGYGACSVRIWCVKRM